MAQIGRTVEQTLARIASSAWGIVTRPQLLRVGITDNEIRHRVEAGSLIRQYKGVYRVGHAAPSTEATYLAAVKACGEEAYLWDRAAAYHQELLPLTRNPPPPAVMCPTQRSIRGIHTKRARAIHPQEVSTYKGIPITTVPRTLLDLAATADDDELARAAHEAGVRHRTTPSQVQAVLDRHPNAKGAGRLRRVMTGEAPATLSKLERGFLRLLDRARIPRPPEVNRRAGSKRVDFRWPRECVTVELDSYRFHNSRHSWEQDRIREREAHARGDQFRRYTWADVFDHPRHMLRELRGLVCGATLASEEGWQSG